MTLQTKSDGNWKYYISVTTRPLHVFFWVITCYELDYHHCDVTCTNHQRGTSVEQKKIINFTTTTLYTLSTPNSYLDFISIKKLYRWKLQINLLFFISFYVLRFSNTRVWISNMMEKEEKKKKIIFSQIYSLNYF